MPDNVTTNRVINICTSFSQRFPIDHWVWQCEHSASCYSFFSRDSHFFSYGWLFLSLFLFFKCCLNQLLLSKRYAIATRHSSLLFFPPCCWCSFGVILFAHVKHFPFNSFPLLNREVKKKKPTAEGKNKRQTTRNKKCMKTRSMHKHCCMPYRHIMCELWVLCLKVLAMLTTVSPSRRDAWENAPSCNTHCKANIIVKLTIGMGMLTCAAWCSDRVFIMPLKL